MVPDGTRVYGWDASGATLVSVATDGSGKTESLALGEPRGEAPWQQVKP